MIADFTHTHTHTQKTESRLKRISDNEDPWRLTVVGVFIVVGRVRALVGDALLLQHPAGYQSGAHLPVALFARLPPGEKKQIPSIFLMNEQSISFFSVSYRGIFRANTELRMLVELRHAIFVGQLFIDQHYSFTEHYNVLSTMWTTFFKLQPLRFLLFFSLQNWIRATVRQRTGPSCGGRTRPEVISEGTGGFVTDPRRRELGKIPPKKKGGTTAVRPIDEGK